MIRFIFGPKKKKDQIDFKMLRHKLNQTKTELLFLKGRNRGIISRKKSTYMTESLKYTVTTAVKEVCQLHYLHPSLLQTDSFYVKNESFLCFCQSSFVRCWFTMSASTAVLSKQSFITNMVHNIFW